MKDIKTQNFIKKSKIIHKNKYDYSETSYLHVSKKVKIKCFIHGFFEQTPNNHLNGQGCAECGRISINNAQRNSVDSFIKSANLIHNNMYDYKLVIYKNNKTKVKIICSKHGVFEQTPDNHINKKNKCPNCYGNAKKNTEKFIEDATKIHNGVYDYSAVNYINSKKKINIICKIHGVFKQKPTHHLSHIGCPKCSMKHHYSTDEFIEIANEIHDNKYNYSKTIYKNAKTKIKITCLKHGEFTQNASSHLQGRGCSACKESYGEREIRKILKKNNIQFIHQKSFINCINPNTKRLLYFDFFLTDFNICIEYNGEQHYKPVIWFGGKNTLILMKKRDKMKKIFCKKNKINLFIIKHNENIEKKLMKYIASFNNTISIPEINTF